MRTIALSAQLRTEVGKGPARRLRSNGMIPAIFYGHKVEPIMLSVKTSDIRDVLEHEKTETIFIKLKIDDDNSKAEKLSLMKDLQIDTYRRKLVHADFYEIKMDRKIVVDISVSVIGESADAENGAMVQLLKRELKVSGLPTLLPDLIEIDVSQLGIGDNICVGDIRVKNDVELIDAEDTVVAAVAMPRTSVLIDEAEEEGEAEPGEEATETEAE